MHVIYKATIIQPIGNPLAMKWTAAVCLWCYFSTCTPLFRYCCSVLTHLRWLML